MRCSCILQEIVTMRLPYFHFPHPTSRKYNPHSLTLVWPDGSYSTTGHVKEYLNSYMMPRAKDSEVDLLLKYYPNDQRAGSPFDTGIRNVFSTVSRTNVRDCGLIYEVITRSAVQARFGNPRRFRFPRPASVDVEVQGQQAAIMGIRYVFE